MGRLTELTQARLAADAAGAWLFEHRNSELVLRGDIGFKRPDLVARLAPPPRANALGWIVDRAGPVVTHGLPTAAVAPARPWIESEGFRSFLGVPLVGDTGPLGMLGLFRRGRRAFTAADLALAEALCVPAGLVIQNARLYREMQAQADELAVLHEIGTTLTSTLDLPTVLDRVVDAGLRLSGAQQCAVMELDPIDQRLYIRAQRGFDAAVSKLSLALGQGAGGVAAQTRAPFFVGDLERESLPLDEAEMGVPGLTLREVARRDGCRAALAVPLVSKETVLGAIAVFWRAPRVLDPREVRLLTGLAQQAAVAMEQAQLHGASVRRASELAVLLRAVRAMLGGLDTATILESVVREASAIAGTPDVKLLMLDRASATLRVAARVGSPMPSDGALPADDPASAEVARTGRPLFRDETYLGLPVKIRETVLGVLTLTTASPRRYSAEELAYLGSFADHAAIALDNARLYEDAQRALSDLRVMQRRLVQGETLRALGELAGGAAHHLNNLLTIVVGRIQLLRRSVREERLARPLEIVERAAKDSAEVVRRLQQFAGMRRTLEPSTVDLNRIVRDALETTRSRWQDPARSPGTEITVDSRLAPLPPIPGDAAALRELLTNLLLNAIDALPRGGRVAVETSAADGVVVLTVTDTGLGMSEEVRLRAHEPFFTTKGVKSTGLGLSVAFGISRRHGGELTLQSAEAEGTTVRVTLPLPAELSPPATPAAPLPRGPLRILLVDDEEEVRRALADMLTTQGHTVVQAAGGPDAVRCLEADAAFDLVVTDLVMPSMTGWQLAAAVKARWPGLRVGVVTGWGARESPLAARASVDFVLSKPVTLDALDHALDRLRS